MTEKNLSTKPKQVNSAAAKRLESKTSRSAAVSFLRTESPIE